MPQMREKAGVVGMSLYESIIVALENCTDRIKYRDCSWKTCEGEHEVVELPRDLVIAAREMLKARDMLKDGVDNKRCFVSWQYCKDPNDINVAIGMQDENWDGLTSADQIISITYDTSHNLYVVVWRKDR